MRIETPNGTHVRTLPMMWSTDHGPVQELVIPPGEERLVPLAARATVNSYLSGDPIRLKHFALPAGVVRVTDRRTLLDQGPLMVLEGPTARFRLIVRTGDEVSDDALYILNIPAQDAPNTQFTLARIIEEPTDS
jgi:hypothetical protein